MNALGGLASLAAGVDALRGNPLRSALATPGVMIGVAARLAQLRSGMMVFRVIMGAITGISLLVGGIGIMNVLLASVAERAREIGIRKAVGARNRDVLAQFLDQPMYAAFSWTTLVFAVTCATGVGLAFGTYPALRASRLSPIDAIRHE